MNNKIIAANNLNYFEKTKEVRTISHLSHQHITANMINDKVVVPYKILTF